MLFWWFSFSRKSKEKKIRVIFFVAWPRRCLGPRRCLPEHTNEDYVRPSLVANPSALYRGQTPKSGKEGFGSGQVRPRQGTEICNFGAPPPLEALHWIFCFFSSIYVQFSKTSPLKSGESSEKSSGENRVKSCHVCGCHGFFGPDHRAQKTSLLPTSADPRKRTPPY